MKTGLIIIFVIHGILHLVGFFKAFHKTEVIKLVGYISKPMGLLWFVAALLFLLVAILLIFNKHGWAFFAIAAVVLSQTLIIMSWQDAKWGTILNIFILLISVVALGRFHFENMVEKEVANMLEDVPSSISTVKNEDLGHLPRSVQKWLTATGVIGKPEIISVQLTQTGEMRTAPASKWMAFDATQYFNVNDPGFNWAVNVEAFPGIHLSGRDKLAFGKGEMKIKLLSLFNVVNEAGNEKINSGSMLRFLGEICWFPTAALNEYITWEEIDALTAKAIFRQYDEEVWGVFTFSEDGDLLSFEAERYYGGGDKAAKYPWLIDVLEYEVFNGIKLPSKCKVTWKLPEGDFEWLNLEITTVYYNISPTF